MMWIPPTVSSFLPFTAFFQFSVPLSIAFHYVQHSKPYVFHSSVSMYGCSYYRLGLLIILPNQTLLLHTTTAYTCKIINLIIFCILSRFPKWMCVDSLLGQWVCMSYCVPAWSPLYLSVYTCAVKSRSLIIPCYSKLYPKPSYLLKSWPHSQFCQPQRLATALCV